MNETFGAIRDNWSWTTVLIVVGVQLLASYFPALKGLIPVIAAKSPPPATDADTLPVGALAEQFASVRAHCAALNDEAAVKALDSVAPCIFQTCEHITPAAK